MKKAKKKQLTSSIKKGAAHRVQYPLHSVERALRIPKAILDNNAGRPSTLKEAASFLGIKVSGVFNVEVSSSAKYGFLERPEKGKMLPSELAKKILRPQKPEDAINGYQQAVINTPGLSDAYNHYRGENIPEDTFFRNTLIETCHILPTDYPEFKRLFLESLETAQLLSKHGDKLRVIDVTAKSSIREDKTVLFKKLESSVLIKPEDTCFVMQPFALPLGDYYEKIYKAAIIKAGLRPVRADADIFGTGKIIDQVWRGINDAKVLVAELTLRNPNVFYELGLAHALKKPVVLVSANEDDVPFDLHHIRVIYYDVSDPFWGQKLIDKVAENILSAIKNPEEAVFKAPPER